MTQNSIIATAIIVFGSFILLGVIKRMSPEAVFTRAPKMTKNKKLTVNMGFSILILAILIIAAFGYTNKTNTFVDQTNKDIKNIRSVNFGNYTYSSVAFSSGPTTLKDGRFIDHGEFGTNLNSVSYTDFDNDRNDEAVVSIGTDIDGSAGYIEDYFVYAYQDGQLKEIFHTKRENPQKEIQVTSGSMIVTAPYWSPGDSHASPSFIEIATYGWKDNAINIISQQLIPDPDNAPQAPESEPVLQETPDPAGIGRHFTEQINALLNNREVNPMLALLLSGALFEATVGDTSVEALKRAVKDIKITDIQNGYVTWKNRELPAAIVTAEISIINRGAGTYGAICMKYAAANDKEFEVMRSTLYSYCEDSADKISEWEKTNNLHAFMASNAFPGDGKAQEKKKIITVPCTNGGGSGGWMFEENSVPPNFAPFNIIDVKEIPLGSKEEKNHPDYKHWIHPGDREFDESGVAPQHGYCSIEKQ